MPTIGAFHSFFFNISDSNAAPVRLSGAGGYPLWQASVVTPSLVGILGAWIDARWAQLQWHWRVARRLHRLSGESRQLVVKVLDMVEHPAYPQAQLAVRQTARTLGFNTDAVGRDLKTFLYAEPGRRENVYRHLHAMRTLKQTACSTLTNHEQHFLTELAYQGFGISRR